MNEPSIPQRANAADQRDPEMAAAQRLAEELHPALSADHSMAARRARRQLAYAYWAQGAPQPYRTETAIATDAGRTVSLRVFTPALDAPRAALIFIHGGGWSFGSMDQEAYVHGIFCREFGHTVLSPDYRLAPEHPFPAGLQDCETAVSWLYDRSESLGIDLDRVFLGGTSAGANLAVATALKLRDAGRLHVRGLVLFYGLFGSDQATQSYHSFADGRYGLPLAQVREFLHYYVPDGVPLSHPLISPAEADLRGLPPVWLGAAELDVLRDDSVQFSQRLTAAGVRNELFIYKGLAHGFTGFARKVSAARAAIRAAALWCSRIG